MSFLAKNIKILRKSNNLTQVELAKKLDIKRSLLGAIEENRSEPRATLLNKISILFNRDMEELITSDLSSEDMKELDINQGIDLEGKNIRHHTILVSERDLDRELISLVPISARAGYSLSIASPSFIRELPKFNLPFNEISRFGTYRVFQISGDSMSPAVQSGDYLITEYIDNWRHITNDTRYIIITKSEGLLFKRIFREENKITLVSDNDAYLPFPIMIGEIIEIWKPMGHITFQID